MKYVVKNCPCFVEGIAIKGMEQKTQTCNNHKIRELTYCKDCTDCVIKQIITICKGDKMSKEDMKRSKEFTDIIRGSKYGRDALAIQILQLFDIEEVGE